MEVVRLYETVLHRLPDAAGLSGWAAARANGLLLQGMAEAFVGSGEFQGRFGELGNRDFVARLYQTALDRPADPAGLDAWTAALDSRALGRGDVVLGFALSAEMTRKVTPLVAEASSSPDAAEDALHPLTRRALVLGATFLEGVRAAGAFQRERVFDSAGVPIRFIEDGAGEPVVLVHGYTSDTENGWVRNGVFAALAERFRAIAFDARGHGRSGKPHDPAAYGPEMGFDVVRLMDHLDIPRAHVVGYSMGAHIVAQLLIARPDRFLSATLGGAAGRLGWTEADQRRVDAEAAEMDEGSLRSQLVRLWPHDQPPPTEEQVRARSARLLAGQDPRALAAVRRSNPAQVVALERLAATAVPVLGVVGGNDPYLRDFERLRAAMPSLRLSVIEGASHDEAPSRPEFARILLDFLLARSGRQGG